MSSERIVGLYRPLRRGPEKRQIAALEARGCGRIWSWDERDRLLRYLRGGEVVVVTVAHVFGPTRDEAEELMFAILARGTTLEVLDPPMSASTVGAAQMAFRVVAGLAGDGKAPTSQEARERGKKNREYFDAKRTPFASMKRYWRSAAAQALTVHERMSHPAMRGWTIDTVYRHFREEKMKRRT